MVATGFVSDISVLSLDKAGIPAYFLRQALVNKRLVDETELAAISGFESCRLLVGDPLWLLFHVNAGNETEIRRIALAVRTVEFIDHVGR